MVSKAAFTLWAVLALVSRNWTPHKSAISWPSSKDTALRVALTKRGIRLILKCIYGFFTLCFTICLFYYYCYYCGKTSQMLLFPIPAPGGKVTLVSHQQRIDALRIPVNLLQPVLHVVKGRLVRDVVDHHHAVHVP